MLDNKLMTTVMLLFHYRDLTLHDLMVKTQFDRETLLEQLASLEKTLIAQGLPGLEQTGATYKVSDQLAARFEQVLDLFSHQQIFLSQQERVPLTYLYTFCRQDFVSNSHYQDFLQVSRNSVVADIRLLRQLAEGYGIGVTYRRSEGYRLSGTEEDKHRLALFCISSLLAAPLGQWGLNHLFATFGYDYQFEAIQELGLSYSRGRELTPIHSRLVECLYFFQCLFIRYQRFDAVGLETSFVPPQSIGLLSRDLAGALQNLYQSSLEMTESFYNYLSLYLMGCFEGQNSDQDAFFDQLTSAILSEMEKVSLISFAGHDSFFEGLKRHLVPCYYRLRHGMASSNTYTETIKKDYEDLFYLVQKALLPLETLLGFPVPDSEISYFVIHFGGVISPPETGKQAYKALIICPNGVSSSLVIKEDLKQLFSNIALTSSASLADLEEVVKGYDMVFSTIRLAVDKPTYLVSMNMTKEQKVSLFQSVRKDFPRASRYPIEVQLLLEQIKKYATIHQEEELADGLHHFLRDYTKQRKETGVLLHELITAETYQHRSGATDWREAISLAAQPLLASGKIESTYIDAMIGKVEEFGPFISLGKGIAIPHARPEDGVKAIGMSMLVLDEPVLLADLPDHPISLFICIAAVDNASHLKALSHLTKILREDDQIEALKASTTYSAIKTIIQQEA